MASHRSTRFAGAGQPDRGGTGLGARTRQVGAKGACNTAGFGGRPRQIFPQLQPVVGFPEARKSRAVTQRDIHTGDNATGARGWSLDDREERLARARLAFDQGVREVSEQGARAARRLLVPALWSAALIGGALLAVAVLRMVRRPAPERALLR